MEPFLTPEEITDLKNQHRKCKEKRHAYRLNCILLLNRGMSLKEISDLLLLDEDTIQRYYNIWEEEGIPGLLTDNYRGGSPKLSIVQQETLKKHLISVTYQRASHICDYVRKTYGVKYTVEGMTFLLHRLGFSYKKSKLVPGKPDKEKQEEFVKEYFKLKSNKASEDRIYFMDATHPIMNPTAGYGWIPRGEEKKIPTHTGRARLNLNGVYCPEEQKAYVISSEMINAQSTIELIERIKAAQKVGMIYIYSDNARYYWSRVMMDYLSENKRVKIIPLPPYSPNLNLIERLWKFFKQKILSNKYYTSISTMKNASIRFFQDLRKYRRELTTLITEKFQIIGSAIPDTCFG